MTHVENHAIFSLAFVRDFIALFWRQIFCNNGLFVFNEGVAEKEALSATTAAILPCGALLRRILQ
jgi:hypothetical protein